MVDHAKSGGSIEVMGLLQGKVRDGAFYISDCFRLPVEGTETRVNAGDSANEYMIAFTEQNEGTRFSNDTVCGWYHSHPGYGCWLSGIDVATQSLYQSHQEPFVAIVIDPIKTSLTGKVEIGAFRTLPRSDATRSSQGNSNQSIPKEKVADFGAHFHEYYPLEVQVFKSSLDTDLVEKLWSTYWLNSLKRIQWNTVSRETAETIHKSLRAIDTSVEKVSDQLHSCSCSRLHHAAHEYLRTNLLNSLSDRMDISQ